MEHEVLKSLLRGSICSISHPVF